MGGAWGRVAVGVRLMWGRGGVVCMGWSRGGIRVGSTTGIHWGREGKGGTVELIRSGSWLVFILRCVSWWIIVLRGGCRLVWGSRLEWNAFITIILGGGRSSKCCYRRSGAGRALDYPAALVHEVGKDISEITPVDKDLISGDHIK